MYIMTLTFEHEVIDRLSRLETLVENHLAHKDKSNKAIQWLIGSSVAIMAIFTVVK